MTLCDGEGKYDRIWASNWRLMFFGDSIQNSVLVVCFSVSAWHSMLASLENCICGRIVLFFLVKTRRENSNLQFEVCFIFFFLRKLLVVFCAKSIKQHCLPQTLPLKKDGIVIGIDRCYFHPFALSKHKSIPSKR